MFGSPSKFDINQLNTVVSSTPCFNIREEFQREAYSVAFEFLRDGGNLVSALSDYSLLYLDVDTMKSLAYVPDAHAKRINDLHVDNNLLFTCSNDGTIKVWDLRAGLKGVGQCKNQNLKELYSVSQVKHIVAAGSESDVVFWDLRTFKIMNKFDETYSDEVTSVQFFKDKPSILLSASLDGMICLFDLSKGDEEEATDTVVRLEQPVNTCRFIGDDFSKAFAQTTVQTVALLSLEEARMVKEVNTIENLDTNEFSLLGTYTLPNQESLFYLKGNLDGCIEEYGISLSENTPNVLLNRFHSQHKGPIVKAERITDKYIISAGEDFKFYITENTQVTEAFDFEAVKQAMFVEDEVNTDTSSQPQLNFRRKAPGQIKWNFDPY